jgi:hypothetical protein
MTAMDHSLARTSRPFFPLPSHALRDDRPSEAVVPLQLILTGCCAIVLARSADFLARRAVVLANEVNGRPSSESRGRPSSIDLFTLPSSLYLFTRPSSEPQAVVHRPSPANSGTVVLAPPDISASSLSASQRLSS